MLEISGREEFNKDGQLNGILTLFFPPAGCLRGHKQRSAANVKQQNQHLAVEAADVCVAVSQQAHDDDGDGDRAVCH